MRQSFLLRSLVTASLLFSVPVLAEDTAPAPQCKEGHHGRHGHKGMKGERKLARMEHRLDRAVSEGRLAQSQADQFKTEARQLREELKAQRDAAGGQLSEDQRLQARERVRALREKVKAAVQATAPTKT
ncbi:MULTISPECIES: hypothetical protein [Myxococcus]|uniref:Lipoprotein n=1 Tax=Myxococcus llanfairpwllgwyngyllgogerychwyrndrobwllllantysiliogogogochensis TaxID=2590453 RepID=A0A540WT80_9BACT|nr:MULTISPECIES: hypothetical protein [Myxococcus]NTX02009.1 hypothetical protein [Myxococcus sp. CA040A]NTX14510.1 hypothetical protein [Myxococcus sp. CA056]TQF11624.1 hypothetical protein FJV41_33240 [Myxococcus llanfairpwllgwyngyllgogerychwyrndrobwllllantysiliogogogochensis]